MDHSMIARLSNPTRSKVGILLGLLLVAGAYPGAGEEPEGRIIDAPAILMKLSLVPQNPGLGETIEIVVKLKATWNGLPITNISCSSYETDGFMDWGPSRRKYLELIPTPRRVTVSLKKGVWKEVRFKIKLTVPCADVWVHARGTHSYRLANGKTITFYDLGEEGGDLLMDEKTRRFNFRNYKSSPDSVLVLEPEPYLPGSGNKKSEALPTYPHLTWKPPPMSGLVGFNVYRTVDTNPPKYKRLNRYLVHTLWYDDYTVQNGTTYRYFVTVMDTLGSESDCSKDVVMRVP